VNSEKSRKLNTREDKTGGRGQNKIIGEDERRKSSEGGEGSDPSLQKQQDVFCEQPFSMEKIFNDSKKIPSRVYIFSLDNTQNFKKNSLSCTQNRSRRNVFEYTERAIGFH
jgi:hypothetical protein